MQVVSARDWGVQSLGGSDRRKRCMLGGCSNRYLRNIGCVVEGEQKGNSPAEGGMEALISECVDDHDEHDDAGQHQGNDRRCEQKSAFYAPCYRDDGHI